MLTRPHPLRRLAAWARPRPFLSALIVLSLLVVPGFLRMENIAGDARDAATDAQHALDELEDVTALATREACVARRDLTIVVRQVVELTAASGGGLNLSAVPGFADLSPELQRYFRNLEEASRQAPDPSSFVNQALDLLVVPDCDRPPEVTG